MIFHRHLDPLRIGSVLLASATATLALISIVTGDFAYTWQPVSDEFPARELAARMTGVTLLIVSVLFLVARTARPGLAAMTVLYALWLLVLHAPRLLTGENWLGFFEFLLPLGACLASMAIGQPDVRTPSAPKRLTGDQLLMLGRVCFGVGLIGCGASHFVYAAFAAQMIPDWLPGRLFFTYLTGAGHIAAGLSLLTGVWLRVSTALLCFMLASFVFLLHVPRVLENPNRYEWTMLIVATLFNGGAWLMAAAVRSRYSGAAVRRGLPRREPARAI